jgi:hypothetical protein
MKARCYLVAAMLLVALCTHAESALWSKQAQAGSVVSRAYSLKDLGISDVITMTDAGDAQTQHFFFSLPQNAHIKDLHIDVRMIFLRHFSEDAALSFSVNETPIAKLTLGGNEDNYSKPLQDDSVKLKTVESTRPAREILLSIPVNNVDIKKGYMDLAVQLYRRPGALLERKSTVPNMVSIDPRATGLVYTFAPDSVNDIRTLLETLPHRPELLIPQSILTPRQYESALRVAMALSQKDLEPEFVTIPSPGDVVDIGELQVPAALQTMPAFKPFLGEGARTLKFTGQEQVAAWLVLRAMGHRGLAQIVIDGGATGKRIEVAMAALNDDATKKLAQSLGIWGLPALRANTNMRVAELAGQPVLLMDEPNMQAAAALLATTWLDIANAKDALLDKAVLFTNDESDKTHFFFPQSQSVKSVTRKAEWVVPFKLADLPRGKWPEAFEINLIAAPTGDRVQPVVSVYLNDNLLASDFVRGDGQFERITARIPQYSISASNYLKVEVRRRCEQECTEDMQAYPVQLLPSSYLALGEIKDYSQFYMFAAALSHDADVVLPDRYRLDAARSLPYVQNLLSALSARTLGVDIVFSSQAEFMPKRNFVTFGVAPANMNGLVKNHNGRLTVRNELGKVVFDGAGLGELATLQLLDASGRAGVWIAPVGEQLPKFEEPLNIALGDFAVVDAHGVKLAMNLADPDGQLQLDEQNHDTRFLMTRNKAWLIALGLLALVVAGLFGLRAFFRRGMNKEAE